MKRLEFLGNPSPMKEETKEAAQLEAMLSKVDVASVPAGIRGMSKSCH